MRHCACRVVLVISQDRTGAAIGEEAREPFQQRELGLRAPVTGVKRSRLRRFAQDFGQVERMAQAGRRRKEALGSAADAAAVEQLRRDLDAAEAERADAVRARHDLEDRREDVLASEDVAQLEAHETAMAAVERRVAVAETRCSRLAGEIEAAEAEVEQARRRAIHAEAEKALEEARRLMRTEYVQRAQAVAETLRQVAALRAVVLRANESLPINAEPIETNVEPPNARHWASGSSDEVTELRLVHRETGEPAPPDVVSGPNYEHRLVQVRRSIPLYPEVPHRAVADFVNLPGLDPQEYIYGAAFWGQPRV